MTTHQYTCLPAEMNLISAGFSTVVALEADRIPLAAFKDSEEATKWCAEKNGASASQGLNLASKTTSVAKAP